jgi:hypothetical protein
MCEDVNHTPSLTIPTTAGLSPVSTSTDGGGISSSSSVISLLTMAIILTMFGTQVRNVRME